MLCLSWNHLKAREEWDAAGIAVPQFGRETLEAMYARTKRVHFGAGNIFRGYIAELQQRLMNDGLDDTGIIAAEAYDFEIIDKMYKPYDNLCLRTVMLADDQFVNTVVGSVSEGLVADPSRPDDWNRLKIVFRNPSLQLISFTITEKGYDLKGFDGGVSKAVTGDIKNGPGEPVTMIAKIVSLLYERFLAGGLPLAVVSMDNCSRNGERLKNAVMEIARGYLARSHVEAAFIDYLSDPKTISFPWSMIDKITPRPSPKVGRWLRSIPFADTEVIETAKHTFIAPFVNTEAPQYLVIEDDFPNGRPCLEAAGVYFTNRDTVEKCERMKVCTCLNPLHTALAIFGCLRGYTLIADEMKDPALRRLVEELGYTEGMPVVTDPGILKPRDFLREVIEERLPNPNIPDTPQRIVSDTSQKLAIRFGETIRQYRDRGLGIDHLKFIPLVLAGWLRYLMGVDDDGNEMPLSPDPLLEILRPYFAGKTLGNAPTENLGPILKNETIFGVDLYADGLGGLVEQYFRELSAGAGAVKATLDQYVLGEVRI